MTTHYSQLIVSWLEHLSLRLVCVLALLGRSVLRRLLGVGRGPRGISLCTTVCSAAAVGVWDNISALVMSS